MEKVKILIVEDERIIAEDLSDILMSNDYEVCDICKSFSSVIYAIEKHHPDLILLDIKIQGDRDGVDVAHRLRDDYSIPFVFISSHSDPSTVKRAVEVNPYGYLVKPFEDEDVIVAVELALSNFAKEQNESIKDFVLNDCLFVREKNLSIKIPFSDIQYIKAEGNYSTIVANDKNHVLRATLKEIEQKVPSHLFYRSHKSYIINLGRVSAINSDSIYVNDERLPIGRGQLHQLMESINKV
ncbi:LytR/AlgR family response regulator transcription factor [Fulvivirga aurantia]|uniref:LytR/AlgR family response regulator transcription factor n=1 Tax=Fulvivirga aurantia TaxID=2529383 RepID=UPI001629334F|nr:response regulator [Fulvivirga aurantia]